MMRGTVLLLQILRERQIQRSATNEIAANGGYEIQGAKCCGSKLYLATNVRISILDDGLTRKVSRIFNPNGLWKLA
jgi:hypothetical protein